MGCLQKVAYGYYQEPEGALDALDIIINAGRYGVSSNACNNPFKAMHVFGSNQNYNVLLSSSADAVATKIKQASGRARADNVIVNWRKVEGGDFAKNQNFLNELVKGLEKNGLKVYVKAPASLFCLTEGSKKFILGVQAKNYIIEMYGENPEAYTSFEEIFEYETNPNFPESAKYPDGSCS